MRLAGVGQREVRHLVNQHPVREELRVRDLAPDAHADEGSGIGEGLAAAHAVAPFCHHPHPEAADREAAVVTGDNIGRAAHPGEERCAAPGKSAAIEVDLQRSARYGQLGSARGGERRGTA